MLNVPRGWIPLGRPYRPAWDNFQGPPAQAQVHGRDTLKDRVRECRMYMLKQWVRRMPVNDVPGWRKLSGHNGNSFKSCVWEGERNLMARKGTREVETVKEFDKNFLTYKGQRWPRDTLKFIVEEVGVPRDKISGVAEASQVMYMNISNIQPKLDFFMSDLYIPRKTLGRVIGAFPQLLTLSLQSNLIPKLRYLSDEIGLEDDAVGRIVMRYPQLLGLSLEHNIQPTIAFLLHEALAQLLEIAQEGMGLRPVPG